MKIERNRYTELKNKQAFVNGLNRALRAAPATHSISSVNYDVFYSPEENDICEYLVITFKGGAISPRTCRGNSVSAILDEFAAHFCGGYYSEVDIYNNLKQKAIPLVEFTIEGEPEQLSLFDFVEESN